MKKRICKRLRSRAGETIAEVLIALLISSLALVILAQMISASTNMILSSEKTMKKYYEQNNVLAEQETSDKTATVTMTLEGTTFPPVGSSETIKVNLFKNDTLGGIDVIAYRPTPTQNPDPAPEGGG